MKKFVLFISVALALPALASDDSAAVEKNRAMYSMMLSLAKNSASDEISAAAQCLGVSRAELDAILERAMTGCFEQHKNKAFTAFSTQMEACVGPAVRRESGFSQKQLEDCRSEEDKAEEEIAQIEAQMEALSQQLDALYQSDKSDEQSAAMKAQLQALDSRRRQLEEVLDGPLDGEMAAQQDAAAFMQAARQQMHAAMRQLSEASAQTLHLITLPIYQNSQVIVHMIDGSQMQAGAGVLPSASFASADAADDILAFYRQKLPGFYYKNLGNGQHILMESMPDDFDLSTHQQLYMRTPHVLIRSLDDASMAGAPAGTQSKFEVSYRERS